MAAHPPKVRWSFVRRVRAPLSLGAVSIALLGACSEGGLVPGDGGPVGSGGAASGGATASGGAPASGGASGGAAAGGAAATGGGSTGGAAATGGTASGGAGATSSGGAASGGAGTGGGAAFALAVTGVDAVDNEDCAAASVATCPLFPQANVATMIGGDNLSPAMSWNAGPEGTMSYAVTLYDVTLGNPHWALYDIPAETLELPAALPSGASLTTPVVAKQAGFNAGSPSYFGSGACENVYEFRLYALSTATFDAGGASTAGGVIDALEAATPLGTSFVRMQSRDYCTP